MTKFKTEKYRNSIEQKNDNLSRQEIDKIIRQQKRQAKNQKNQIDESKPVYVMTNPNGKTYETQNETIINQDKQQKMIELHNLILEREGKDIFKGE